MTSTNNLPLVSINIPVYKCEQYIFRCLESVKNQTYSNLEIILVNDCTPDNSVAIIEEYIIQNPDLNIKLIQHDTNGGLSVVRNTGIDNSNGKYIYFLDSDDDLTTDCIEKLVNKVNITNAELVLAQNRWINTFDNSIKDFGFATKSTKKEFKNNEDIFEAYTKNSFPVSSWNKLVNLEFIRQNKIYFIPGLYAQDELWMFHLMEKVNSLSIIDDITYNYYLHGESVIFNRTKKNFENYITILQHIEKSYRTAATSKKRELIKFRSIHFKNMVMIMQWKAMKNDVEYFKTNYKRMKKIIPFKITDLLKTSIDLKTKKLLLLQNLPTNIGVKLFIKRYG